jgi:hypothetical protein
MELSFSSLSDSTEAIKNGFRKNSDLQTFASQKIRIQNPAFYADNTAVVPCFDFSKLSLLVLNLKAALNNL